MRLPNLVIVGRPNVGKSSLMNMLAGRLLSIVEPTAGVTRDRISTQIVLPGTCEDEPDIAVQLMDTGGIGIIDAPDLAQQIERQIAIAVSEADVILFVIDTQSGITPLDEKIARMLHSQQTSRNRILLVCNKVDSPELEMDTYNATRLGFGEPLCVSATTRHGKNTLMEALRNALDLQSLSETDLHLGTMDPGMLLAIVGKRNAGKSTLVNALAGQERVIVNELAGTTRDSVDVRFEMQGHILTAIDTAGVRKHKSIQDDIEYYSHHRSLRSIRRAHVVFFMIDASVPISQVDKQLGNEIIKHHKPVVLVVNKWDLAQDQHTQEEYAEYLDKTLKGMDYAPIAFLSAKNKEGLRQLVGMALNLNRQANHRVSTGQLNRVIREIIEKRQPPAKSGRRLKVFYVTQLQTAPPTIGLFVNHPDLLDLTYERFLINRMRDVLPYSEVPIRLLIRPRKQMPQQLEHEAEKEEK